MTLQEAFTINCYTEITPQGGESRQQKHTLIMRPSELYLSELEPIKKLIREIERLQQEDMNPSQNN